MAGKNIGVGTDHTLFAKAPGTVHFRTARKMNYDGRSVKRHVVDILAA
jgi:ribosomal protein L27